MTEQVLSFAIHLGMFLFAISFHEAAHAITAKWGGDFTAESLGRITMNPVSHMDPVGTLVLPAVSAFTGVPLIGWAKPVPVVESNMCRLEWPVVVALAGPFSNIILAVGGMLVSRLLSVIGGSDALAALFGGAMGTSYLPSLSVLVDYFVMLNLMLASFNLMPIPPLDGHWVVWHCFVRPRPRLHGFWQAYCTYGPFVLMGMVLFGIGSIWMGLSSLLLLVPLTLVTSVGIF
jgi:Zn-dependent protease